MYLDKNIALYDTLEGLFSCVFVPSFSGGAEKARTPDPLLAKPRIDFALAAENGLECFIKDKKNQWFGYQWSRDVEERFLGWLPLFSSSRASFCKNIPNPTKQSMR